MLAVNSDARWVEQIRSYKFGLHRSGMPVELDDLRIGQTKSEYMISVRSHIVGERERLLPLKRAIEVESQNESGVVVGDKNLIAVAADVFRAAHIWMCDPLSDAQESGSSLYSSLQDIMSIIVCYPHCISSSVDEHTRRIQKRFPVGLLKKFSAWRGDGFVKYNRKAFYNR